LPNALRKLVAALFDHLPELHRSVCPVGLNAPTEGRLAVGLLPGGGVGPGEEQGGEQLVLGGGAVGARTDGTVHLGLQQRRAEALSQRCVQSTAVIHLVASLVGAKVPGDAAERQVISQAKKTKMYRSNIILLVALICLTPVMGNPKKAFDAAKSFVGGAGATAVAVIAAKAAAGAAIPTIMSTTGTIVTGVGTMHGTMTALTASFAVTPVGVPVVVIGGLLGSVYYLAK